MNSVTRFFLPKFFRQGQKPATDFFDRQLFSLQVTIYLTLAIKAIFTLMAALDPQESEHIATNPLTILVACLPAIYFLRTNRIVYAKFFAYFPTVFIQGLSAYYVILEKLPYGYAELALMTYIPSCIMFYETRMAALGIVVNVVLYVGVKIVRFQQYNLSGHELALDFTMSALVYAAMIMVTYLYKNDFVLLKKYNSTLNEQNAIIEAQASSLKAINSTKDRLFGIISHDLRSPLAALISIMQLLENKHLSKDEFRELTKKLGQNTGSLYEMLEGLLQWSLSQTEGIKPELKPCNLGDIVEETTEFLGNFFEQKQISLTVDFSVKSQVLADKYQLTTVLRNLLSNALKFTPNGGKIMVSQRVENNFVRLTIADTGVGMSEHDLQQLFYSPKITVGTDGEKGTGFGLFLCKELIEKNGGQIVVTSRPGAGTSIEIALPVYETAPI